MISLPIDFLTLYDHDLRIMVTRYKTADEKPIQFKVSPRLKKAIQRKAFESDETVRVFVLKAIQQRGVSVAAADLVDRRKGPLR